MYNTYEVLGVPPWQDLSGKIYHLRIGHSTEISLTESDEQNAVVCIRYAFIRE